MELGTPPQCDLDGNGDFGVSDVAIMSSCWGTACTARVPSLTPTGAGLAAGIMVATGTWIYRRRWNSG